MTMFADLLPLYPLVVPFLLVLFRLVGLFAFMPFFANAAIPVNVKAMLGLAMAFCVWNVVPRIEVGQLPEGVPALIVAVAGEMTVGLMMGLLFAAVVAGIQLGAHQVSLQMGLSMATLYDPTFDEQSTVIEQIAFWLALVAFLTMGGHRQVIEAVVYSFKTVPLGSGGLKPEVMLNTLLGALDAGFHASAKVAMPALVAFFVATISSGLISRAMPQLNMQSVGIPINLIIGFVMVMLGMTGWALVGQESLRGMFDLLAKVLG